ncbi:MAG: phosphoribosyltransferase [Chitinophagaceae bacterium]|jgi:pyrimidine operon attenuation protein/uracil phosphoribosyltransferase|nr:phosphoribosyltransferase [Chitinophagaceae bacterium]
MSEKNYILSKDVAERKLKRMTLEILEQNSNENNIVLVGIRENGLIIASIIANLLKELSTKKIELIGLTIDKTNPIDVQLDQYEEFSNKVVIVVDDVINSGKTMLYALKPLLSFSPKKIQILVMVARSYKQFPIHPDYVGISLSTTLQEHIFVEVENQSILGAYLV